MQYTNLCFRQFFCICGAFVFGTVFLLVGCDDNTTSAEKPKPKITDALILLNGSGGEATIEAGETVQFTGYALTESGEQIPLAELSANWDWEWQSTDPAVFTVDTKGKASGEEEGEAYCVITLNGPENGTGTRASKQGDLSAVAGVNPGLPEVNLIFVGRDSAFVSVSGGF